MSDWSYREQCPWCAHTFYSEPAFKAHVQAEVAIEKSCASIRSRKANGGLEEAKKEGLGQPVFPSMRSGSDVDVFGDWE